MNGGVRGKMKREVFLAPKHIQATEAKIMSWSSRVVLKIPPPRVVAGGTLVMCSQISFTSAEVAM